MIDFIPGVFHELAIPKLARGFGWAQLYGQLPGFANGTTMLEQGVLSKLNL